MSFRKLLTGWTLAGMACVLSVAQAAPPVDAASVRQVRATGPLGRADVLGDAWLPTVHADMNARVIRIPVDADGTVTLETTIYRPSGPGPFPMVVFNHGKILGDPHDQARSDPVSFAREFVRRGYVVVAPNRQGFAGSGGTYRQDGCDVAQNGLDQAADVAATIAYMSKEPYVDAGHIVVAGTSHGGLATVAYGTEAAPGVRALINFTGGLRQDTCTDWQNNLIHAFGGYGSKARVASLWLYGDNDSVWTPELVKKMFAAYRNAESGDALPYAGAKFIDFGTYKNDAHRLVGDRDGVAVWWPVVEAFLARQGMPTAVQYQVAAPVAPQASGYAAIDSIGAVPFLDQSGRDGYRNFLKQYPSRAFAVSASGAWSWAEGGDNPMAVAVANCEKNTREACHLYAVNDSVVWSDDPAVTASNDASAQIAPAADTAAADDANALASR